MNQSLSAPRVHALGSFYCSVSGAASAPSLLGASFPGSLLMWGVALRLFLMVFCVIGYIERNALAEAGFAGWPLGGMRSG